MGEEEQYEKVCKGQFGNILTGIADLKREVQETKVIAQHTSDRLLKTNGKRAVVTCVEDNKKEIERVAEELRALKKAPTTATSELFENDGEHGELELSRRGLFLKGPPNDIIKMLLMLATVLLLLDNRFHVSTKFASVVFGTKPAAVQLP